MSKSIEDFHVGDQVYHLSNTKLRMVVVEINVDMNEISCRWIDNKGQAQQAQFLPQELGDVDDLRLKFTSL